MTAMTAVDTSKLWPGFSNPVADSQHAFRLILTAMSEPGQRVCFESLLDKSVEIQRSGIADASFVVALTLLDQDTAVWLSPALSQAEFSENLRFHCGCALVSSVHAADFVFMSVDEWSSLAQFKQGDDENPHHSATLVIQTSQSCWQGPEKVTQDWPAAAAECLTLSGPGICGKRSVQLPGITDKHLTLLQENQQIFPLGKDLLFVFADCLMAIPRSTRLATTKTQSDSVMPCEDTL